MVRAGYLKATAAAVAFCAIATASAHAETYSYSCRVGKKTYPLRVNEANHELVWKGKAYKIRVEESCAKFGWRAERSGESFNFCTATQGYADFEDNGSRVQCGQR